LYHSSESISEGLFERECDAVDDEHDAYVAYQEGTRLLTGDNVHAAVIALERARLLEPAKGSVREALARAYYRSARFADAEHEFRAALDLEPVNDYAHYGVGLCRLRAGDRTGARAHLRLATVMRPDNPDYLNALADAEGEVETEGDEPSGASDS
jgi:Flp pilus assembly protein TadD